VFGKMTGISAVIITKNEGKRIRRCLENLAWVDEIVVVDSFSSDDTYEICRHYTDRVYRREFDNFENQRNYAIDIATGEWIFSVDADEVIGEDLRREIEEVIKGPRECVGLIIPMESYLFNMPVKYTWGDYSRVRLFKKEKGSFLSPIHERVTVQGRIGVLKNPFLHYNSENIEEFIQKNNVYTTFEAKKKYEGGERFSLAKAIFSPIRIFFFRFMKLKGYKDGLIGLVLSVLLAVFNLFIHLKLWQMCIENKKETSNPC
jgi:glycosyltransferase involved in cell wall biosynthesis